TLAEEMKTTEEIVIDQRDPTSDGVLNILIIGNSASTGWPDELNGLLKEAGIKAQIYTVYYSGCPLSNHWTWLKNGKKNYRLRHHKQSGGIEDDTEVGLDFCLKKRNWDIISLQQSYHSTIVDDFDYDTFHKRTNEYAKNLYDYIRERHPKSRLVWFQTWSYNVGFNREGHAIKTQADQDRMHENIVLSSTQIATANNVPVIPCSVAWQIARANPITGDMTRDQYHDGDVLGGQYLNACVWFEFLTGQSCVGSPWRPPKMQISEEKVAVIQNAAHQAVTENAFK
ncbi:MAG: DUF4886 domain-containing protein, partial [Clostridia bacterium]|nr:DUF4886 domain-containing protein [Clostridia bacterium]